MSSTTLIQALGVFSVLGGLVACVDIAGAQRHVEREDKRFTVSGRPDVSLSTFDGSIEIRPSDGHEVTVTIERRAASKEAADRIEVHAEQNGNHIVVDCRLPKIEHAFGFHTSISARLVVSLPAGSDVQANSGDGSIDIERINGAVDLRSGDGSIAGRSLTGTVKAHTGDGTIRLDNVDGAIDADTGDGTVTINGRLTGLRARSGDGRITVHAAPGSTAETDWSITTGDGSIVLEVPEGFAGELDAHTSDGSISMHDLTLSNVNGQINRNTVRGRLGAGGRPVRVRTGDGSITLRRS